MDQVVNVLVTITLVEMMVATGLGVALIDLKRVLKNLGLVVRAALANYVFVPAAAVGLLYLFDPHPMVAAGFLVLAVCPGAPYGPPATAIAKGNMAVAVGLMILLAGSSAFVTPLLLYCLLPSVSGSSSLEVDATRIVGTLVITQLLPLCVGVAVRQSRPTLADRLQKPAKLASKYLNLVVVTLILLAKFPLLAEIRPRGWIGMLALLVAGWAVGWLAGGPTTDTRKAMALTSSIRNSSVGLVIAITAFAGTPAITAVVAYGLVSLLGTLAFAAFLGAINAEHVKSAPLPG